MHLEDHQTIYILPNTRESKKNQLQLRKVW